MLATAKLIFLGEGERGVTHPVLSSKCLPLTLVITNGKKKLSFYWSCL